MKQIERLETSKLFYGAPPYDFSCWICAPMYYNNSTFPALNLLKVFFFVSLFMHYCKWHIIYWNVVPSVSLNIFSTTLGGTRKFVKTISKSKSIWSYWTNNISNFVLVLSTDRAHWNPFLSAYVLFHLAWDKQTKSPTWAKHKWHSILVLSGITISWSYISLSFLNCLVTYQASFLNHSKFCIPCKHCTWTFKMVSH